MLKKTFVIVTMLLIFVFSGVSNSQDKEIIKEKRIVMHPDIPAGMPPLPDLTETQINEIEKIHLKTMKDILPLRNKIGEEEARLRTITTQENPDRNEINKLIDEIGDLMTSIRKTEMNSKLDIRSNLTDKQKIIFDTMPPAPPSQPHGKKIIEKDEIKIEK